jgi:hypothetical protein
MMKMLLGGEPHQMQVVSTSEDLFGEDPFDEADYDDLEDR